jgi:hypothetical protein
MLGACTASASATAASIGRDLSSLRSRASFDGDDSR